MSLATKSKLLDVQFSDSDEDNGPSFHPLHQSAKPTPTDSHLNDKNSSSIKLSSHKLNSFRLRKNILHDDGQEEYEIEENSADGKSMSINSFIVEDRR